MTFPIILSVLTLIICLLGCAVIVVIFKRYSVLNTSIESQKSSLEELDKKVNNLNESLHEIRSGNYGVMNRVRELVQQVDNLHASQNSLTEQLVEQDPQSRFYSKGAKLISQGASLEDVMRECDMPAAEAELLFNLHNKHK